MKKQKTIIPEDPYTDMPSDGKHGWKTFAPILYGIGGVLVALLIVIEFFGTYDKALDNYFSVYAGGKYLRIGRLAPHEYWDTLEREYGVTLEEVRETYKEHWDEYQEQLEEIVGKNPRYTYRIKKEHQLDDGVMQRLAHALGRYGIEETAIKKAYRVELSVKYTGNKDSVTVDNSGYVVHIGTNWYLFALNGDMALFPVPLMDMKLPQKDAVVGTAQEEYGIRFFPPHSAKS